MIQKNPRQKPLISRLGKLGFSKAYEFNLPSNAFRWYTGKEPVSIGEKSLSLDLSGNKEAVFDLLNTAGQDKSKEYSLVALSSWLPNKNNGNKKFHCLPITDINLKNRTMKIINKRTDEVIKVGFEEFTQQFKAIVGTITKKPD